MPDLVRRPRGARRGRMTGGMLAVWLIALSAGAGEGQGLEALARKAGGWKSYAFVVDEKPGPAGGPPLEGKYQAGRPADFKAGGVEFYRRGDALAYRDAGRWRRARTGTLSDPPRFPAAPAPEPRAGAPAPR